MQKFTTFKKLRMFEQEVTLNQPENKEEQKQVQVNVQVQPEAQPQQQQTQGQLQQPEEQKQEVEAITVSKFISKLLQSREMAQVYHWTVNGDMGSHASHLALESYYDGVIGFIDEIVEVYQGQYDLIEEYDVVDTSETKSKDKVEYFKSVAAFIKTNRNAFSTEDTHIHNIIDEVVALLYKTIYKLRFNK